MSIEAKLCISLLKLTQESTVLIEDVKIDSRLPRETLETLLQKLQNENIIYLKNETIEADTNSRLKLAVKAVTSGIDIETVSNMLRWQEFEEIATTALTNNNFQAQKNVHFKNATRKYEIDALGCKKPIVLCIDCKHWQHGITPSALKKIVEAQIERAKNLAETLPNPKLKMDCTTWTNAKFVPAVLSLLPSSFKFYNNVPIVPVLQLQDFLNQLPANLEQIRFIPKTYTRLMHDA
jgi:hypothetical protein